MALCGDENVGRLQVTVQLAGRVDRSHPLNDLAKDGAKRPFAGVIAQEVCQPRTWHEVHRKEPAPHILEELPQPDEVWMGEIRKHAKLSLELIDARRAQGCQGLERDVGLLLVIVGIEDDPHPALAQLATDGKATVAQCVTDADTRGAGRRRLTGWTGHLAQETHECIVAVLRPLLACIRG